MANLIDIARTHDTANLKRIQKHQRNRLLKAQRNHDHLAVRFLQERVDAAALVLTERNTTKATA